MLVGTDARRPARKAPAEGLAGEGSPDVLVEQDSPRQEDRQRLRQHDADEVEDESEMERQVRDQLYGPGFRRR
jgi:hypothetical protein